MHTHTRRHTLSGFATLPLLLSFLTDSSLAFVFSKIFFLSITSTDEYFLFSLRFYYISRLWPWLQALGHLSCCRMIEIQTLRQSEPRAFNPRRPKAVSVWVMNAESHICACVTERGPGRNGVYFSFCEWFPFSYFSLSCSSPDFGNHLL